MNNSALLVLGLAIPSLPFLAVAIGGLALSLSRRALYPRAARWATIGFACLLLQVVLSLVQPYMLATGDASARTKGDLLWIVSALYVLRLATLVAIGVAVFSERQNVQLSAPGDVRNAGV